MDYQSPKLKYILITISVVFILVKLFTAVIILKDDPTNFMVLKLYPSLENEFRLFSVDEINAIILLSDENGIAGENFYFLIAAYLWWIMPIVTIFLVIFSRSKTHTDK